MTREVFAALLSAVATGFAATAYSQTPPTVPALPEPPSTPAPNSITPEMAAHWRDWRHLPNPVSDQQFMQDEVYCAKMGNMAAVGQGSPLITYGLTFLNCLRSKGYEPVKPVLSTEGTTQSEAEPKARGSTEGTTQSEAKPKARGEAQGLSVEDRACITKAAGKLPKIATIEQSRVQDQGRHERDLYHVKVEIDVSVAGQTSTYIFNCIHSGDLTVIQPLGMR
jgi:hypothetical protein